MTTSNIPVDGPEGPTGVIDADPRLHKNRPDKEALELAVDRFEASQAWRRDIEPEWTRWYKLYRSYIDMTEWPFATALFIPIIFSTIESYLPRLTAQRPRIKVEPRNDEDAQAASIHRQLLDYQWDLTGMPVTLVEFTKDVLIYGTGFLKVGWAKTEAEMTFIGAGGEKIENKKVITYNDPVIDNISIDDIFPDPTASTIEAAAFICHRLWMSWWQLDALADLDNSPYKKAAVTELKAKIDLEVTTLDNQLSQEKDDGKLAILESQRARLDRIEVVEYWEDNRWIVYARHPKILLVNEENPYWHKKKPFIRAVDNILSNEFYGIGEAEILESICIEMNAMHNLRLEQAKRLVFAMLKIRRGRGIIAEDAVWSPSGAIFVDEPDDITPMVQPELKGSSYREEDLLRMLAQEVTGSTDNFKGLETNTGSETATGASILAQAAASRAGLKFQLMTEMALRPLGRMLLSLNEQNLTEARMIAIVGPEGETASRSMLEVRPEDLARTGADIDVRIDIGATDPVSRELKTQRVLNAFQYAGQVIQDITHPVMTRLMGRLLELLEIPIDEALLQAVPAVTSTMMEGPPAAQPQQPVPQAPQGPEGVAPTAHVGMASQVADSLSLVPGSQAGVGPTPGIT
jgi:hypothetical protein